MFRKQRSAVLLAALGLLFIGYRKLSRSIDEESKAVMHQEQDFWKAAERRVRLDAGTDPPAP